MDNNIYCLQNISDVGEFIFGDNYPANIDPEHQADLILAFLAGHLPGTVFQAIAKKLEIDNNRMAIICDKSFNKVLFN